MMNRPSAPTPNQPPSGLPGATPAAPAASDAAPAAGSVISALPGPGPVALRRRPPAELAATLPPGNVVILGGPGSGKTALLEATMHHLLARPGGTARFLTSSRQAAVASTERLLAGLAGAAGGELGCVTWYAFARGLVTSHADLLDYRGEPRPLSGPEQWSLVRSLLTLDQSEVDWGPLAPLVDTRAFTDELAEFVLACERRLLAPEDLLERATAEGRPSWVPVAAFLALYGEHLALQDSVDQAGLILQAGDLLEDRPEILAATVAQVGTILVDEAQELDPAQLRLLTLLVGGGARAVLAGDPAGTTDAFRGATPGALPAWARRLGASVVLLERSRRLGGPGLDAVRRLQAAGPGPVIALTGGGTTTVEAARYPGPAEEAEANARLLRVAHERDGIPYGRMAVLLPSTRRLSAPTRRALERFGVPYRLGAGERQLVAEPVVGHVLNLFRLALDPTRADELLPSLLTSPLGGLDPGELRVLRRAALLADRSLTGHVRARAVPPLPEAPAGPPDPDVPGPEAAGPARDVPDPAGGVGTTDGAAEANDPQEPGADGGGAEGPVRAGSAMVLDPGLVARVEALCDLVERAEGWVAELDADACFWEVWRAAPAFSELILRAEVDPTDADVQRQLDALTAFSRALSLFVDGRPGASMRTYLDVVERADFASDPWLPPAMTRTDAVAVLSVNAAKGQEFDLVIVAGCLEGALPTTARPQGLFEAWRLDGDPGPVARADALLDAERRRFTLAASRARDRVVFTASRVDGRGEPSRFLRELGLELPADPPAPGAAPLGLPGGRRRPAPGRGRPGPAGRRTTGRRDHPGGHPGCRPGDLVVAARLHRRPRADRRRGAPADLLLADRDLRGLPPEVLLRQRGRARRPLLLPDGLRPAHAHHLRAGRQGRHRQRAGRPQGRLPPALQPRLVPVEGHRLPVLARRHGHARAVAPQRGRGRPPGAAVRGRVRDGGRGPPGPGPHRPGRPGPGRRHRPARLQDRPLPGVRGGGRALAPAGHLLPGRPARPRAGRPRPARSRCSSSTRPGSCTAASPASASTLGPTTPARSSGGCWPSSTGRPPSPSTPTPTPTAGCAPSSPSAPCGPRARSSSPQPIPPSDLHPAGPSPVARNGGG